MSANESWILACRRSVHNRVLVVKRPGIAVEIGRMAGFGVVARVPEHVVELMTGEADRVRTFVPFVQRRKLCP